MSPAPEALRAENIVKTFGAVAHGLRTYREIPFAGVIANRVAGAGHVRMLRASLGADIPLLGALPALGPLLPERHLGLVQAEEQPQLALALDRLAEAVGASGLAEAIREKKASSREVVEAHLARIEAVNPAVNAVTVVLAESARAALSLFRDGPERRVLADIAAFCVERGF